MIRRLKFASPACFLILSFLLRLAQADSGAQSGQSERWAPLTAGPIVAGTAEVNPVGTWWYSAASYFQKLADAKYVDINTEGVGVGLGKNLGFNASVPVIPFPTDNYYQQQQYWFKWQINRDEETHHLLALPAFGMETRFVDQSGDDKEGVFFMAHKRFKPFELYAQLGAYSDNPIGNGPGAPETLNGMPFNYAISFEDVLSDAHSAGYVIEAFGQNQSNVSFYGKTNAPSWGYFSIAPEIEFNWPNKKSFALAWDFGCFIPVYAYNYVYGFTPMINLVYYFNWKDKSRMSQ
jgi:hypothetical protein